MAIGLAWMVGLRFPDNFDQPYRAVSVIAYWQRWHMSLTRFLMTTVHAPLTLAVLRWRRAHGRRIDAASQATLAGFFTMIGAPIVVTMVLISLWHGATLPFLLFGLAACGIPAGEPRVARASAGRSCRQRLSVALTYLCVLVGSVVVPRDHRRPGGLHAGRNGRLARNGRVPAGPWRRQPMCSGCWPCMRSYGLPRPRGNGCSVRPRFGSDGGNLRRGPSSWGAPRRSACSPPGAPANSCISGSDRMRYLRLFGLSAGLSFALLWGWVAAMPMAFMDAEYASWRAKLVMLDRCDLGEAIILGDSRAAADIIPTRSAAAGDEPRAGRGQGDRGAVRCWSGCWPARHHRDWSSFRSTRAISAGRTCSGSAASGSAS